MTESASKFLKKLKTFLD